MISRSSVLGIWELNCNFNVLGRNV